MPVPSLLFMGRPVTPIFPRETIAWKQVPGVPLWRKIAVSLVWTAVLTGVVVRLFRALVLTSGPTESVLYLGGAFAIGTILLLGGATLHLSNFTIRHWWWRAPAFAIVEFAAEMATSFALTWAGMEPLASGRAQLDDWSGTANATFFWRVIPIALYALFLAVIVFAVRAVVQRREDSRETRALQPREG